MIIFSVARSSARRYVATLATAVLLTAVLPAAALANHAPNHGDPCAHAGSAAFFADYQDARQIHSASIDCAYYRAITSGSGTNSQGQPLYQPLALVTRAQMAQFIVNTLIAAGYDDRLASGAGPDQFDDISGNFARLAINRLARAGIVRGTAGRDYSPDVAISRQQMASFMVQAANFAVNPDVAGDAFARFNDVSAFNPHKPNIESGADARLFRGTSTTTFAPGRLVVRDQMATFLINLLRFIFDEARAPLPFSATASVDSTSVTPGQSVTGQVKGSHMSSVTISGCGISPQALVDRDETTTGIQYAVTVPTNQATGACSLSYTATFDNGTQSTSTIQITVRPNNQASVTINQSAVPAGGQLTGQITGTNLGSARLSGCGLNNEPLEDRNNNQAGIQFTETIPAGQPTGNCSLTFAVTFVDNRTENIILPLTVGSRPGQTTRPELIQAAIVSTTTTAQATASNPAGTVVRYFFDEPVSAPNASRFFVYAADATRSGGDSGSAQVESGGTTVLVRFSGINSPALASGLTTATVDDAAANDAQGQTTPEGAAPLAAVPANAAGITAAPDLLTVGGFRAGAQANTTAVDFTFDEAAFTVTPAGFHLVLTDGVVVNCTGPARDATTAGGGQAAGGNGTTRITAVCPTPTGRALTTTTVARGYVDAVTVSDVQQAVGAAAQGNTNPQQIAEVGSGGTTSTPDLERVTLTPGASATDADTAVFNFDADLETAVTANRFVVYDPSGREFLGVAAVRLSGAGDRDEVSVTFAANAFDALAGAAVREGAVTAGTTANRADEVGIAGPAPTGTPGVTAAPDLVSAALSTSGSGSSQVTTATYTFDEDLNPTAGASQPNRFHLYLADGTQLTCSGVFGSSFTIGTSGSAQRQATCRSFQIGTTTATAAQVAAAVLGTVDQGAVDDADTGTRLNPEGHARTTGGTGTPTQ